MTQAPEDLVSFPSSATYQPEGFGKVSDNLGYVSPWTQCRGKCHIIMWIKINDIGNGKKIYEIVVLQEFKGFKVPQRMLEFDAQPTVFWYHISKNHFGPLPLYTPQQ